MGRRKRRRSRKGGEAGSENTDADKVMITVSATTKAKVKDKTTKPSTIKTKANKDLVISGGRAGLYRGVMITIVRDRARQWIYMKVETRIENQIEIEIEISLVDDSYGTLDKF